MPRLRRSLVVVLLALGLVVPTSFVADAADPVATTTRWWVTDSGSGASRLSARVWAHGATPAGTVVFFRSGSPDPLGAPVPVGADGIASVTVPTSATARYAARFTGADGFADSVSADHGLAGAESVSMKPEGTILKLGLPSVLKVTLTFAVHVTFADGAPATGEVILFTQKNSARGASGHPEADPQYVRPVDVCLATVDVNGLATCRGTAATSSILTLLTTSSWANHELFPAYQSTQLPILTIG